MSQGPHNDLVSVIIPVYNGSRYLAQAVESIWEQRHDPVEVVVVDDGSQDGSFEMAQGLTNVRCFRQANGGSASARNFGVREARGTYLAFLDADDLWAPGKLALQLSVLHGRPEVHLVAGRVEEFYEIAQPPGNERAKRRSGDRAYTTGALLVRREDFLRVGWMDPALKFGEFMDWRSRALALGMKEHVPDVVVLRRRIHDQNTTLRSTHSRTDYVAAIKAHLLRQRAGKSESRGGRPQ